MSVIQIDRPITVRVLLEHAVGVLRRAGVPDPDVDALLLLGHVLGATRGQVQALTYTDSPVTVDDAVMITEAVERRAAREPLQHITGSAGFRTIELAVGPGVFVPRPETEFVAGLAIDSLRSMADESPIGVDLGTGSGAIALSMAVEVPHAQVVAVENSTAAFVWAKQNFHAVDAPNARLVFIDLADALHELDGLVSVVISNPPYIPTDAIPRDPEVRLYDPEHALYGGADGLDVVRQVSLTALRLLRPGGALVMEHGELQAAAIRSLLQADGWNATASHRDLTGRDRATTALR
ncbi:MULTISPECIES: peptide chain release factor N(5)-glutamine methyltransferase [Subtercola]|uniref:Release factor glutamine methyltransferase n=1 Tax=Subtercola vilae TaxID=2056433 RepID=A0A4T2BXF8_9MICO|nr:MULTISPECIES: peptide chain release factor N(5)-glutamine methyltransferase [Subtercola]MEA9985195.1 peptide chain release factor N(5)-glutamine methyltransferase [Subtercola sp. RTI3]TIH34536.1 peptide chain release factor N(5)-glutamine methyltransferase [Subtercola vilae]